MIKEEERGQKTHYQFKVLRSVIYVGLLVAIGWYVYGHKDELAVLLTVRWYLVVALGIILILNGLASAAQFVVLYRALGPSMSVMESFGLSRLTSAMNQLLPGRPGGIVRLVYMKHRYGTPYSQTPAILLGNLILSLFIGAVLMALTNTIALLSGRSVPLILWIGVGGSALSVVVFWISIPIKWSSRLGRVGKVLNIFSEGWRSLRSNKACLVQAGTCQLFAFAFWGAAISVSYRSLGMDLNPLVGVSIAVFMAFSNILIITPGNLGIQEVIIGYLSQLAGLLFVEGVAASALIRATELVITLIVAPIAWYLLFFRRSIRIAEYARQDIA